GCLADLYREDTPHTDDGQNRSGFCKALGRSREKRGLARAGRARGTPLQREPTRPGWTVLPRRPRATTCGSRDHPEPCALRWDATGRGDAGNEGSAARRAVRV